MCFFTRCFFLIELNEKKFCMKSCSHYERKHKIIAPCCGEVFGCRFCHDEETDHQIDRFLIDWIECEVCGAVQKIGRVCEECGVEFSKNYCGVCRSWSDGDIFHCEDCGICRKGNRDEIFHCLECDLCVRKGDHKCKGFLESDTECFVCLEPLKFSTKSIVGLECSHYVHAECFEQMLSHSDYKCGLCRKSGIVMTNVWNEMSKLIDTEKCTEIIKVKIHCYDCGEVSETTQHSVGLRCGVCGSFNTSKC